MGTYKEEKHNIRYQKWLKKIEEELDKTREMNEKELDKLYKEYYKNY